VVNGVLNGEETTLVVQMFGKPLLKTVATDQETTAVNTKPTTAPITKQTNLIPQVLARENTKTPLINVKNISYDYSLLIFGMLVLALISDLYFAYKLKIVRITGKHFAHFIFIGFVFIALIVLTKGVIL